MAKRSGKHPRNTPSSFIERLKAKSRARRDALGEIGAADARRRRPRRNDLTPELSLRAWRIADLRAPSRNVRRKLEAHAREIAASIEQLGYCDPIIVDGAGEILDGLERVEACKLLGIETIQCVEVGHLTAVQKRLLRLAANRLQEKGGWSVDDLKIEFEELILDDAPIEITGFDGAEIDHVLLEDDAPTVEQGPLEPDPDAEPIARSGDVFQLGDHRLICGDARDPNLWRRVMAGGDENGAQSAALVLTDTPYNVKIQNNVSGGHRHREFAMASGEMSEQQFFAFNLDWIALARDHLRDGGVLATYIDWRGLHVVTAAGMRLDLSMLNLVVWAKTNAGMGSLYRSQHELLTLFKKGDAPHVNNIGLGKKAGRYRSNLWTYPGASSLGSDARKSLQDHPTVKPVAMLEDALLDLTNRGDIVLDPFLGSGSTLIAAEKTGRRCFGFEIDPLYVDVIIRRWEAATKRSAKLLSRMEDTAGRDDDNDAGSPPDAPRRSRPRPHRLEAPR